MNVNKLPLLLLAGYGGVSVALDCRECVVRSCQCLLAFSKISQMMSAARLESSLPLQPTRKHRALDASQQAVKLASVVAIVTSSLCCF